MHSLNLQNLRPKKLFSIFIHKKKEATYTINKSMVFVSNRMANFDDRLITLNILSASTENDIQTRDCSLFYFIICFDKFSSRLNVTITSNKNNSKKKNMSNLFCFMANHNPFKMEQNVNAKHT